LCIKSNFELNFNTPIRSQERTANDLDIIYEELVNIKALSHFSSIVKKELSSYLFFESHNFSDKTIIRQGEEVTSWYIILKGSVDVSIYGKGVVTTFHEGNPFITILQCQVLEPFIVNYR